MTDPATTDLAGKDRGRTTVWGSPEQARRFRARRRADQRLRLFGLGAVALSLALILILIGSLGYSGHTAFTQTHLVLDVTIDPAKVRADEPDTGNYRALIRGALWSLLPKVRNSADRNDLAKLASQGAPYILRDRVVADPSLIGQTIKIAVPVSDPYDQLHKGVIPRTGPEEERRLKDKQIAWFDDLVVQGQIESRLNWGLLFNSDSRFPELAGLAGAISGSFYALLVCFALSFPIGIASAVYLEEFAPRNRWTSLIEVNINNLAAVPSVVFGLLGLAVFIQFFGIPRSTPLVGGMTLALMTLPTIIIATRLALAAVPPSIREAALGLGASGHQVVLHHVLPLAMPGIMTGTIIGMARALGETAPLLLIGMNAFIISTSGGILEPATALPTQIFIWADSPERGFAARTAAGILVLIAFLVAMNLSAVVLRRKFERRW
ncbi:MAG: phosphate ABC transporter permease PstA [Rhodospirillaceae bacterium]|jgi:phosphate transport system permease protein|nr:phosphate ABC transporter permease PstA [Rhodospirillaceae bacterium]MBT6139339.1 phosphate ABC transporter permease PstA [Rhodospirillaceae bacterium]